MSNRCVVFVILEARMWLNMLKVLDQEETIALNEFEKLERRLEHEESGKTDS